MGNTALVTGASSGIGTELARYHASKGGDVVLVARSEDKLNALKSELESAHSITATVIAADLAQPDAAECQRSFRSEPFSVVKIEPHQFIF